MPEERTFRLRDYSGRSSRERITDARKAGESKNRGSVHISHSVERFREIELQRQLFDGKAISWWIVTPPLSIPKSMSAQKAVIL